MALHRHRRLTGWLASILLLAAVTGVIELLKGHIPALSLSVLYLLAVLPVAVVWGMAYAIPVAIGSMLCFNFFFLPPLYTLTLQDSRNWFALGVFVLTAIVVSQLAARQRRQAQESALLARVATTLLEHGSVRAELEGIAAETARVLDVEEVRIDTEEGGQPSVVAVGRRRGSEGALRRLLPALSTVLRVAFDRERLVHEAVEAEALRRSDAAKTAILRAVSHDLRTPLMAILTSSSALVREDLELGRDDRTELARTIMDEASRLDRLVANLLDLSRLQAGAAQPEPKLWPVEELVVQALDELGEAGQRIEVALPEDSPAVRADAHQVERVLVNLIENALKYSAAVEPVRVQVTTSSGEVLVRVVDRGLGIPASDRERIFEAFQRGGDGSVSGAGLGLAIARGFAEANGGRVWAESLAGQGTAFVLALPAEELVTAS